MVPPRMLELRIIKIMKSRKEKYFGVEKYIFSFFISTINVAMTKEKYS